MTRTAIITGASSGIGAAAASMFLDAGFAVINISRRPCPITGVTDLCGDLSNPKSVQELARTLSLQLAETQPSSVCLVHNAALMLKDTADSTRKTRSRRSRSNSHATISAPLVPNFRVAQHR